MSFKRVFCDHFNIIFVHVHRTRSLICMRRTLNLKFLAACAGQAVASRARSSSRVRLTTCTISNPNSKAFPRARTGIASSLRVEDKNVTGMQ